MEYWIVKSPLGGFIFYSLDIGPASSVEKFLQNQEGQWYEWLDKGYSCVKVKITEI